MLQDEYYVIERQNNDNHPLMSWDQPSGKFGLGQPVEIKEPVKLSLAEPISPKFEWVDFHELPRPVFSKRVYDVLAPMDIYGVQFVPAKVRNPKDDSSVEPHDYWFMHVWNKITCLDRELSELDIDEVDGRIWEIEKLVLDEKKLVQLALPKRLVFELKETASVLIIHESIKEAIMSVNPAGCRFFKVTEWNDDSTFS